MTIRQALRDAAIAALNTDPPTGVPETTKRRYTPGQKIAGPRLAAFFGEEEATRIGGPGGALAQRRMVLALQAVIVCEDPGEADDLLEPLLEHVVAVMGATTLNGMATRVEEIKTVWEQGPSDAGLFILGALTTWMVQYQTRRADLASAA